MNIFIECTYTYTQVSSIYLKYIKPDIFYFDVDIKKTCFHEIINLLMVVSRSILVSSISIPHQTRNEQEAMAHPSQFGFDVRDWTETA